MTTAKDPALRQWLESSVLHAAADVSMTAVDGAARSEYKLSLPLHSFLFVEARRSSGQNNTGSLVNPQCSTSCQLQLTHRLAMASLHWSVKLDLRLTCQMSYANMQPTLLARLIDAVLHSGPIKSLWVIPGMQYVQNTICTC